ncbi:ankyrin repeat-containing protein At5g02620-like [Neltuma alba]|uniref:ankyrin repeat-containing protein At5g02620-like n=1 Tax=Neltuma alba TaxID=207710 RepID=UPI0010A3A3F8|nr:ankyrin repeat-containing protein At5g02620-like [Prosopis alba]
MGSSSTANSWDQRIESLKSRERQPRIEPPSSVKKDFKASNLMTTELYMAIRSDMPNNFVAELEGLCGREGSVHVSDIAEQLTRGGNTMLHLAAKNGSVDVLQLIVNHFPQLIIRTNITGDTALHFAARIEKVIELTRIILNSYAAQFHNNEEKNLLRIKNEFGNTALHEAVRTHDLEIARLIFEADKDVANYLNNEGKSPLYLAVETKQDGTIDLLLEAALQNQESHHGTSPLHAAIMVMCSGRKRKHRFKPLLQRLETDKSSNFESSPSRAYDFSGSYTSFLKLNLAARTTLTSQPKVQGTGAQPNASTTRTKTKGWGMNNHSPFSESYISFINFPIQQANLGTCSLFELMLRKLVE